MKKHILTILFLGVIGYAQAQINIDPTAVGRLVQLKNLVDKAKSQIAEIKNDTKQNASTKSNTTGLLETATKIEDLLRNPNEYSRIANNSQVFSDAQAILKLNNSLKNTFTSNLNTDWNGNIGGISSGLRLGTGERILVNKAALDLLTKAQELREKGDKLMSEALERTATQKKVDGIWAAQLWRNNIAKIKI